MKCPLLIAGIAIAAVSAFAVDKKDLTERYKHRYVVVVREGLAVGACAGHPGSVLPLNVTISGDTADYKPDARFGAGLTGCGQIVPEPLHKGDVLFIHNARFHKGQLYLLTSIEGIFAAGDVRVQLFRQVSTGVGDGNCRRARGRAIHFSQQIRQELPAPSASSFPTTSLAALAKVNSGVRRLLPALSPA